MKIHKGYIIIDIGLQKGDEQLNLLHLKYAIEIDKTRSINRAAENLYMSQPNLSRAIKDLEKAMGVKLFSRTTKGMTPTPEGEEFLGYARKILAQIDQVENMFSGSNKSAQRFSVSVPRSSYISYAFSRFCKNIDPDQKIEFYYQETNNQQAIRNIMENDFHLGIVRYNVKHEENFCKYLKNKRLKRDVVTDFKYRVVVSEKSPLADRESITRGELEDYISISHADPYVPSLPTHSIHKDDMEYKTNRQIFVYERASQFELLDSVENTYMWVSPLTKNILDIYGLKEIECSDNSNVYRDVLIYRDNYNLSKLDNMFIKELKESLVNLKF